MQTTSLSKLSDHDWQVLRSHWAMYTGFSFVQKLGRKWTVQGFGMNGPLFRTKTAAERYVSNLVCAESRCRMERRQEAV